MLVNMDSVADLRAALKATIDFHQTEATELRRQLEHANRWRDTAIVEANEARAEAADLRRQLAECRAVAQARGESLGYAEADTDWGTPPHRPGKGSAR